MSISPTAGLRRIEGRVGAVQLRQSYVPRGDDGMGEVGNRRESKRQDGGDGVSARWLGTHATEGWRDNRKYWQLEMARH